jgi:D-tyrosyl-tRNA(Tyr) deacylase
VTLVADDLESRGVPVSRGEFGAHMTVQLTNDGPVTLVIDSP